MIRGKKKRVRKASKKQQAKAAMLFVLAAAAIKRENVRQILYKAKWGMRLPYAYVVWRTGKQCKHRDAGKCTCRRFCENTMSPHKGGSKKLHRITCAYRIGGPICGDVWEYATFDLETHKLLGVKCYMHGHVKPRKDAVTHAETVTGC